MERLQPKAFRRILQKHYHPGKIGPEEAIELSRVERFFSQRRISVRALWKKGRLEIITSPLQSSIVRGLIPELKKEHTSLQKIQRIHVRGEMESETSSGEKFHEA